MAAAIGCDTFAEYSPRFTAGISVVSSALIIVIILRSSTKLTTVYHRLMFGMSCADVIGSLAMGLTNLPKAPLNPEYHCSGVLGNVQTCEAQGFLYIFGLSSMFSYNAMLVLYYACAIAFRMREKKIVNYVEPVLHILALGIGLAWAVPPLVLHLYNTTTWDAWCSIALSRTGNGSVEAGRNIANIDLQIMIIILFMLSLVLFCFALTIWRVFNTERSLYGPKRMLRHSSLQSRYKVERSHKNTKILLYQAVGYFLTYMITLSPLFLRALIDEPIWVVRLSFVLMPLQGFFNALIFIYHKIYNYRRINGDDTSRCNVFKQLLKGSVEEQVLFSRISMIEFDQERNRADIELEDERTVERIPQSEAGEEAFADDQQSRNNLSGFSSVLEGVEVGDHLDENNETSEQLNDYSNEMTPSGELEPQFIDNTSIVASIKQDEGKEEEGLSYSKTGGSVLSSIMGLSWSQDARSRGGGNDDVSSSAGRADLSVVS